jgi:hypothetical protein
VRIRATSLRTGRSSQVCCWMRHGPERRRHRCRRCSRCRDTLGSSRGRESKERQSLDGYPGRGSSSLKGKGCDSVSRCCNTCRLLFVFEMAKFVATGGADIRQPAGRANHNKFSLRSGDDPLFASRRSSGMSTKRVRSPASPAVLSGCGVSRRPRGGGRSRRCRRHSQ